jgi:hypothetical protein
VVEAAAPEALEVPEAVVTTATAAPAKATIAAATAGK